MKYRQLFLLLLFCPACFPGTDPASASKSFLYHAGAIVRGDTSRAALCLVFTGDEFADGGRVITSVLDRQQVRGSFFLTGNFYRNPEFKTTILQLRSAGHYLGAHSDQHLLYCDWENRDSLLVSRNQFETDLEDNYAAMEAFGIRKQEATFFLPPYEWYNDTIAAWTKGMDLVLVNMSPGTLSHADYTLPGTPIYRSSKEIYQSILDFEASTPAGLNGFLLLTHVGTQEERSDKFYGYLEDLILELKHRGYAFKRIDKLLN